MFEVQSVAVILPVNAPLSVMPDPLAGVDDDGVEDAAVVAAGVVAAGVVAAGVEPAGDAGGDPALPEDEHATAVTVTMLRVTNNGARISLLVLL
jgi:hypothetical protein